MVLKTKVVENMMKVGFQIAIVVMELSNDMALLCRCSNAIILQTSNISVSFYFLIYVMGVWSKTPVLQIQVASGCFGPRFKSSL